MPQCDLQQQRSLRDVHRVVIPPLRWGPEEGTPREPIGDGGRKFLQGSDGKAIFLGILSKKRLVAAICIGRFLERQEYQTGSVDSAELTRPSMPAWFYAEWKIAKKSSEGRRRGDFAPLRETAFLHPAKVFTFVSDGNNA